MRDHAPDPIDVKVGAMIRRRRQLLGVTQTELARACGVTFQQIQKYERATNRVSAAMLLRIAAHLRTPIAEFYPLVPGLPSRAAVSDNLPLEAEGQKMARIFLELDAPRRRALLTMVRALKSTMFSDRAETLSEAAPW